MRTRSPKPRRHRRLPRLHQIVILTKPEAGWGGETGRLTGEVPAARYGDQPGYGDQAGYGQPSAASYESRAQTAQPPQPGPLSAYDGQSYSGQGYDQPVYDEHGYDEQGYAVPGRAEKIPVGSEYPASGFGQRG